MTLKIQILKLYEYELKFAEIGSNANVVEGELFILVTVVVAGDVNINNTVTKTFALF